MPIFQFLLVRLRVAIGKHALFIIHPISIPSGAIKSNMAYTVYFE